MCRRSPVFYDKETHKRRNAVERSFNTVKQWRSLNAAMLTK